MAEMVTIVWLVGPRGTPVTSTPFQLPSQPQSHSQATRSSLNSIRSADNLKSTFYNVFESIIRLSVQQQYFNEPKLDRGLEELLSSVSSIRELSMT